MQIVSIGDNLHEKSKPVFWEKTKKNIIILSFQNVSAKIFTQRAKH